MVRTIVLNGAVSHEERDLVQLFDRTYRLKPVTRSLQKRLNVIQKELLALGQRAQADDFDDDAGLDEMVGWLADGVDCLLEIEGQHRTTAKKLLIAKWEAEDVTLSQIEGYFEQLQQDEVEARPT